MSHRFELPVSAVAILFLVFAGPAAADTAPTTLSGSVLTAQADGSAALPKALVELVVPGEDPDDDQVKQRAYTDSKGQYVFRGVPAGTYALRVKLGHHLLYQKTSRGFAPEQRLRVGSKSIRMPPIIVRAEAG